MAAVGSGATSWARTAAASLVVGVATSGVLLVATVVPAPRAQAAEATSSAVTVTARDQDPDADGAPFPDLSVTVSQTEDLVNQGVRLTYSGGRRSTFKSQQSEGADFLQVMQCWGDLVDKDGRPVLDGAGNRQPDRTTCQYGSLDVGQGQTRSHAFPWDGSPIPSGIAAEDRQWVHPGTGSFDQPEVAVPFRSATGKTVARVVDGVIDHTVELVSNEFYGPYSTNEVPWAGFGEDGTGTVTFEMQTAMQAPGLGCGNPVTGTDGAVTGQPCWLVVVPRGRSDDGSITTTEPALLAQHWRHRLAVRLGFQPVGARCAIGAAEQHVSGSELVAAAIHSWQPVLCNQDGGSVYSVVVASESDVAIRANGTGVAPLALVSRPVDAAAYGTTDDLRYAPVAVTGLTVAFAVDHVADPLDPDAGDAAAADQIPFTQMRLTPRLLAKLLTNSYRASLPTSATVGDVLAGNPWNITQDGDFLELNPGWRHQSLQNVAALADVFVPLGSSDSARAVWDYVMADADAREFLAGTADPWGMRVNPWATTDAELNATVNPPGIANEYPTNRFPKPDPSTGRLDAGNPASSVDAIGWRPYSTSFDQAAGWVLRGDNRVIGWDPAPSSGPATFVTVARNSPGRQQVLGLTDTSSAAQYGVYTAELLNPAGQFVAPTTATMTAAADAMTVHPTQPQVVLFDPTSEQARVATDAYPLTVPVYAATNPAGGDAASRAAAVALIRYAAGAGQTPGTSLGELPAGYAPLPAQWRAQALSVADLLAPPPEPAPTPTPTTVPVVSVPFLPPFLPPALPPGLGDPPGQAPPGTLPSDGTAPSGVPEPGPAPAPSPSGTGAAPPVVGSALPDDEPTGALGAAVPLSAAGGLLAAAAVPFMARPRRRP